MILNNKILDLLESQTQNGVCGIKDVISQKDYSYVITQQFSNMKKLDILALCSDYF